MLLCVLLQQAELDENAGPAEPTLEGCHALRDLTFYDIDIKTLLPYIEPALPGLTSLALSVCEGLTAE